MVVDANRDRIVVSICCITYNHERYIAQAIDGFLMQKTTFPYEIIIGEDSSTDRTREIVVAYQARHPELIRVVTSKTNVGMRQNGKRTRAAARGKYISLCEGDDYWTDPYKLQKQVDFLENHPECAMCFHSVTVFYEDGSREAWDYCPPNQEEISTIEDLLQGNFISTCSIMFRRGLFGEFPDWYYKVAMADWPLHILNAQYGKIGYISKIMAAHRIHRGGAWSAQRKDRTLYLEAVLEVYKHINAHLNFTYETLIKNCVSRCYYDLAVGYANSGDLAKARMYASRYAVTHLSHKHVSPRQLFKMLLRAYLPTLHNLVRSLRNQIRPARSG